MCSVRDLQKEVKRSSEPRSLSKSHHEGDNVRMIYTFCLTWYGLSFKSRIDSCKLAFSPEITLLKIDTAGDPLEDAIDDAGDSVSKSGDELVAQISFTGGVTIPNSGLESPISSQELPLAR